MNSHNAVEIGISWGKRIKGSGHCSVSNFEQIGDAFLHCNC